VPLDSLNGLTLTSDLGGNGAAVTVSSLNFVDESFPWNDSSTTSTAVRASGSTINGIGIKLGGTVDLAVDTIGRVSVNNQNNALLMHDASDRLVATLDISGASLTASYSGYNTASRTANMTFDCNNPAGQTYATISNPVLGSLNSDIFVGYSLTNVSLTCSGGNNVAPSSNEASFTVSGTALLDDTNNTQTDLNVTITGTVYVDTSNLGFPTKGSTASVLTVSENTTGAVVAQITLGTFTFNCTTARNVTFALNSITDTASGQSTFDLTDLQTLGLSSSIGGMTLQSTALEFSGPYSWNSTVGRTLSSTVQLGGNSVSLSGSSSSVTSPTISVTMDAIGRYSSASGTIYVLDGSTRLVATLTLTGLTNLNYVSYNPATPTATITFHYVVDSYGDTTAIGNPQLSGSITASGGIWSGVTLAAINLLGSTNIAHSSSGSINLAGSTATLNGRTMNITGTVGIGVDSSGVPSAGNITMTLTDQGLGVVVANSNTTISFNDAGA
jgi:hypothetical protein